MTIPFERQVEDGDARVFAAALREQIEEQAREGSPSYDEATCFAHIVGEMFDEAGVLEDPEICLAAGRLSRTEWELSGWALPRSDEEDQTEIGILTVHHVESGTDTPVGLPEVRRLFERAVVLVQGVLEGHAQSFEGPPDLREFVWTLHAQRPTLRRVVVHVVTDGPSRRVRDIEPITIGNVDIVCSVWDVERLSRLTDPKQEEILVDVVKILGGDGLPALSVPTADATYHAYLCVIPGPLLCAAYEQYGQRLLEMNVRAFLSLTGKVNKGIRETILKDPVKFFPYNNGLALVARRVETVRSSEGVDRITRIHGLQVVNGGQTTASLHRAWKLDGAAEQVAQAFVQAKLVVITTAEEDRAGYTDLVRSISRFANTQNTVKGDDLEANQPWHVTFEQLSRTVWAPGAQSKWFYERARGSYAVAKAEVGSSRTAKLQFERLWPRSQLVSKTDLAKAVNAWSQRPDIVSLGGQKNFGSFMRALDDQLHHPRLDEAAYKVAIGQVILMRDATRVVRNMASTIPAYRANVVAYLVSYLSFRVQGSLDFATIWEKQSSPPSLQTTLGEWAVPVYERIIGSAGTRNVTEWCKREACWGEVRALDLTAPTGLAKWVGPGAGGMLRPGEILDSSDSEAISECLRLQPHEWQALQDWCFGNNGVHFAVKGIVQTLRLQALNGWTKKPSVRQARPAAREIRKWREATSETS